jgi:hypothetical protein
MPAGSTYTPIATTTLGTTSAAVTFSSISSSYTDLVLVISATTSGGAAMTYELNGDGTAANYSVTGLFGDGSAAGSYRSSNNTLSGVGSTAPNVVILNFQNYSNATTFKTLLARGNEIGNDTRTVVSLWRNTAAINQIVMKISGGASYAVGSTFTLYGIASA